MKNLDKYRADLDACLERGDRMRKDLLDRVLKREEAKSEKDRIQATNVVGPFENEYQQWYSEASAVIQQSDGHDQLLDSRLAARRAQRDHVGDAEKAFRRLRCDWHAVFSATRHPGIRQIEVREQSLRHRATCARDLFDSELDAARELHNHGFLRAAGIVAGVVLEGHLQRVAQSRSVASRKKHPTISDFNDGLKEAAIIEVMGLIDGTAKVTKTVY